MKFAGLFDCKNLKAHGEAILLYKESFYDGEDNAIIYNASSTTKDAFYDDFILERLPLLGPLNYAPYSNDTYSYIEGYVPVTKLTSYADNVSSEGKLL